MKLIKKYLYNISLALIQLLNVFLGGDPDGSVSARLGYAMKTGRPKWWVPPLLWANDCFHYYVSGELNHSEKAVEPEETYEKELWKWHN